ncbi:nicotinate-nucleotide adenylyltransferase [Roseococcus sp. DSY-14]|uniref:nicotinate-nucleotide adenylyltransferase n=1 Tax=Roseococcus sp. DSY-14 TaxID=3369650 RepID=UPI00387B57F1
MRRTGLLGGSFNPAHAGHLHVAQAATRALRLHEAWLLVSPGNPLKPRAGMAPFAQRLASARAIARPPRLRASDAEARLGTRFTVDTLERLRRRFPRRRFALVIGADNLLQLPRWRRWRGLVRAVPLAVLPRPGYTRPALRGAAASVMRRGRRRPAALMRAGSGWALVPAAERAISATAIRSGALGVT